MNDQLMRTNDHEDFKELMNKKEDIDNVKEDDEETRQELNMKLLEINFLYFLPIFQL